MGVLRPRSNLQEPLGHRTSIFQAGVWKYVAILSDSQEAIIALSNCRIKSKLVMEVRTKLGRDNDLPLRWIKGHIDIPGNEDANDLAKAGAECLMIRPEPFYGVYRNTQRFERRTGQIQRAYGNLSLFTTATTLKGISR